jgi:hypothetical protein
MDAIRFDDNGRTFTCEPGTSPATPGVLWWWVRVSGESQRYAAFRTEPSDNAANVRPRILAYYAQILVDRERPRMIRPSWAQRRPVTPDTAATPGSVVAPHPATIPAK